MGLEASTADNSCLADGLRENSRQLPVATGVPTTARRLESTATRLLLDLLPFSPTTGLLAISTSCMPISGRLVGASDSSADMKKEKMGTGIVVEMDCSPL